VPDRGRSLEFGLFVNPSVNGIEGALELAALADRLGLDFVSVQDHPYQRRFLDAFVLLAWIVARTERVRAFPNVANLPLRPPAMLAKAAASLDRLSGGRFELALGAGWAWPQIAAMGGPERTPGESVAAVEEGIGILRGAWRGEEAADYKPGPQPAHPIEIWIGAIGPRMMRLTARLSDGWLPSMSYVPPDRMAAGQTLIDETAAEAGRDPAEIRRLYNLSGKITDGARGQAALEGPAEHWVDTLAGWATQEGVDTFIASPGEGSLEQVERFAGEVVPAVRDAVESARRRTPLG